MDDQVSESTLRGMNFIPACSTSFLALECFEAETSARPASGAACARAIINTPPTVSTTSKVLIVIGVRTATNYICSYLALVWLHL